MQDLQKIVIEVLRKDERFISQEWDLLKNTIREQAEKLDENLIGLLLDNEKTREVFFIKIKDVIVFDSGKFIRFVNNKEFLPDSYTSFKNKIGLTNGKSDFISSSEEIYLDFPYKDCILAWWQDKEDAKRDEIFYNEILGSDDIDRLLDEKVFTQFKRFDKNGESDFTWFQRDENGIISENMIIKGNNLLTLHSLESNFAWKLDLIYIDPPYNTWGNGDTFEYNNRFKHSSWLTFMKNRLDIAKKLLKKDWAMVVAIDKAEQVYLWVLLEEIFPEHESHCITIIHNPRWVQGTNFSYTHEFAFFIIPRDKKTVLNRKIEKEDIDFSNLRNWWSESERSDAKNCFYPITIDKKTMQIVEFGDVCEDDFHPPVNVHDCDFVNIYPVDASGVERKWRYARQSVEEVQDMLLVRIKKWVYDIEIWKDFWQYRTVWTDKRYDANEYGTKLIKSLVPWCKFSFPKSLWNVYDCIYAIVSKNIDAKILDFFGWSGTTAHAVLELNKQDNGNRKFILTEQMDYINTVTVPRVNRVIEDNGIWDFVYMEQMTSNQIFIDKIARAKTISEILSIYNEIKASGFINYNIDIKNIDSNIDEFGKLSIEDQKKFLIELLDKNMLYVNMSEIDDIKNGVSDDEKKINRDFYNVK